MENEIWKPIKDYEGLYEVSSIGRVRSMSYTNQHGTFDRVIILKGWICGGYPCIQLTKNNEKKTFKIHRLVAETFIPNPNNLPEVDHINTVRDDNRVENLRWVTHKENMNNELTKLNIGKSVANENNGMYGKYHSEETKNKMSKIAKKGEDNPKSIKVVQLDKNTNELIKIWDSLNEAEKKEGYHARCISACCKGKRKTHKRYKWMYYTDYIELNKEVE